MSESSQRGKLFELKVARILRSKLGARVQRDSRSGAGINKSDISDYYMEIPMHLELKDQETVKPKEWFRQADAAASFNQAPVVVFNADEEVLSIIRFSDLVNFVREIADQKAEIDDLRAPIPLQPAPVDPRLLAEAQLATAPKPVVLPPDTTLAVNKKKAQGVITCREGHIADQWGYCQQLKCKYSRGYKPPKAKRR